MHRTGELCGTPSLVDADVGDDVRHVAVWLFEPATIANVVTVGLRLSPAMPVVGTPKTAVLRFAVLFLRLCSIDKLAETPLPSCAV